MDYNKVQLPIGMESKIHVRVFPANDIQITKKPDQLSLTEEEKQSVTQTMTFQFETVNYPKDTQFQMLWIVEQKGINPRTIPIREEIAITTVKEWEENGGKKQCVLREFTIPCDYVELGLFGKGKLKLEIAHDYQYGDRPTAVFEFDYPVTMTFVMHRSEKPIFGTPIELIPTVHDVYKECDLRLAICEMFEETRGIGWEGESALFEWDPDELDTPDVWHIGCQVCERLVQRITWPYWGDKWDYQFQYQIKLFSQSSCATVQSWTPLTTVHEPGDDNGKELEVRKPKLTGFTLDIDEIPQLKEPFDPEKDILSTQAQNRKWKTFRFQPTVEIEGLHESVELPMLIEYRYYTAPAGDGASRTISVKTVPFWICQKASEIHELQLAVKDENEESRFVALLHFPLRIFEDQQPKPFHNVLGWLDQDLIPWGDRQEGSETIRQGGTVHGRALRVGLQTSAQETENRRGFLYMGDLRYLGCCRNDQGDYLSEMPFTIAINGEERYQGVTDEDGSIYAPFEDSDDLEITINPDQWRDSDV